LESSLFFRLGKGIYRFRILIILCWIAVILSCVPFLSQIMTPFHTTGFTDTHSESAKTDRYLNQHLGFNSNRFLILYHSKRLLTTDPTFMREIKKSLSGLKHFPMKHEIVYPESNIKQISKDEHYAYAVVLFKNNSEMKDTTLKAFKAAIKKPAHMDMYMGGEAIFVEDINQQTQKDLYKSDMVAAPASIIALVIIFGAIVAAIVPIVLGGGCALIILTTLYCLGHFLSLSVFTINVALLLGLCLSLDYSLFIIYRFREELRIPNNTVVTAIGATLATAGRSVFFSGLAVFISLSALLFFPINILFSVGVGGLAAVFVAVAISVTLLPAVLSVLKHGINGLSVRRQAVASSNLTKTKESVWHRFASFVTHRPYRCFIFALVLLLSLAYPFKNVRFGIADFHILPTHSPSYQFFECFQKQFKQNEITPITLVVKSRHENILSPNNISKLYAFAERLKRNPLIAEVNGIVSTAPKLEKGQYQALYQLPNKLLTPGVKQLLRMTTRKHFTVISVISKYDSNATETGELIRQLHRMHPGKGLTLQLTGIPVSNTEVMSSIARIFPYAILWVMGLTYLILLILLRSVVLPLKALIVNILSLCASYGVLVFIFQEGHLHQLLNFSTQGMLDISLLIIIFCALFGFSMDYEVFLLTRIKEHYDVTKDNQKSVILGIEKSCTIITSAAVIVIILCASFMLADVLLVKEFGLGIAVAIFVDAFIIRALLVPSMMVLLNQWNWYLPKWLDKILP